MENSSLAPLNTVSMLKEQIGKNKERKEQTRLNWSAYNMIYRLLMLYFHKIGIIPSHIKPQACIDGFPWPPSTWKSLDMETYTKMVMNIPDEKTRYLRISQDFQTITHFYSQNRVDDDRSVYNGLVVSSNIEDIIDILQQPLSAVAYNLTKDPELAKDLLQQTWMKLFCSNWLNKDEIPVSSLFCWLRVVMHNISINYHLRQRRVINVDPTEALLLLEARSRKEPSPESLLIHREAAEEVSSLLEMLPQEQCQAIYLHYIQGRKLIDIAKEEGVPASTVRTRLRRGLLKIGKELQKRGIHQDDIALWFEALQIFE